MSNVRQPPVPKTVKTASGKARWKLLAKYLTGTSTWEAHDVITLERMVLNVEEAEAALEVAQKSPLVVGSTGQDVANPLFAVAARCDGVALACARALGLTAATRSHSDGNENAAPGDDPEAEAFAEVDELARQRARNAQ